MFRKLPMARWMRLPMLVLAIAVPAAAMGCAGADQAPADPDPSGAAQQRAQDADGEVVVTPLVDEGGVHEFLQRGDRVLFLGDDVTQQMFYTQATAAGLLALMPRQELRFFNGGRNGSSAADAVEWAPDLLELTRPTVVFVLFGLHEGLAGQDQPQQTLETYRRGLSDLAQVVGRHESVRRVIVASPLPAATLAVEVGPPTGANVLMSRMAEATVEVAREQGVGYVNLFEFMRQVYIAGNIGAGARMTFENGLPTEEGHVVIASALMAAMGVTAQDLEAIGWSPLPPRRMHRVRQVLAIAASPPDEALAARSRALYTTLTLHDERFFRAWRLAGRSRSVPERRRAMAHADEAWRHVQLVAMSYYAPPDGPAPAMVQPLPMPPHPGADEQDTADPGDTPQAPQGTDSPDGPPAWPAPNEHGGMTP